MTNKAPKKPKQVKKPDPSKSSQLVGHPEPINLSLADQAAFAKALMDPLPLNEAMVRAMQRRSELLAKGGESGPAADEFILPEMVTPKRSAGKTLAQHVSEGRERSCSWPQVARIEGALKLLSRPRIRAQALNSLRELAAVVEYQGLRIMQLSSLIVNDERGDPISQEKYEDLQARAPKTEPDDKLIQSAFLKIARAATLNTLEASAIGTTTDRMAQFVKVYELAEIAFPQGGCTGWLRRPNMAEIFDGKTPLEGILGGLDLAHVVENLQAAARVW